MLEYAFYDKWQFFAPLSSSVPEQGTVLGEALWSLETEHTPFVPKTKTHLTHLTLKVVDLSENQNLCSVLTLWGKQICHLVHMAQCI